MDVTSAENHTTIICIAPSPLDKNVIWVGTDDGNLQLTRDGGKNWSNLVSRLPGCPTGAWIPQIEVSTYSTGEAFVVVNNYRRNDWAAYTFHTTDFGETWTKIVDNKQITSFVQCITQDPVVPELLFLGADDGLYMSLDKGVSWSRFPAKVFPRVSTMDLKIHPTDHSLAIATFGRAMYVMDNLLTLREITKNRKLFEKSYVLFPPKDAIETSMRSVDGIRFSASAEFKGDNRRGGAIIPVYVKPVEKKEPPKAVPPSDQDKSKKKEELKPEKKSEEETDKPQPVAPQADSTKKKEDDKDKNVLKIVVLNSSGDTIRRMNQKLEEGWNTVTWDLRNKGVRFPSRNEIPKDADDPSGDYVVPGKYKITTAYNKVKDSVSVNVTTDPRLNITSADLAQRTAAVKEFNKEVDIAHKAFKALQDIRKDIRMTETMMANAPDSIQTKIKDKHKELNKKIGEIEVKFMEPEDVKGYTNPINLNSYLYSTNSYINSALGDPGANAKDMLRKTHSEVEKVVKEVNDFIEKDWKEYKEFIAKWSWPLYKNLEPLKRE